MAIYSVAGEFSAFSARPGDSDDRVETEVARGEHYDGAREHRAYRDLMRKEGTVNFTSDKSRHIEDSGPLVRLGLMRPEEALEQSVRMTMTQAAGAQQRGAGAA